MAYEYRAPSGQQDERRRRVNAGNPGTWLLLALGIGLIILGSGKFPLPAANGGARLDLSDIGGLETIRIASGSASVRFEQADVEGVGLVRGDGLDRNQLEVVRDGANLDIAIHGRLGRSPANDGTGADLTVRLPPGLTPDLMVSGSSGQVLLEGMEAGGVTVRSSSGSVRLEDSTINGDVAILTSSGTVFLHELEITGAIQVTATAGNSELQAVSARSYDFVAGSGRFDATGLAGTRLTARASAGQMNLSAVTLLEDWYVQASAGALTVSFDELPEDFTFAFEGSSGSLQVAERYGFRLPDGRPIRYEVDSGNAGGPRLGVRGSAGSFRLE